MTESFLTNNDCYRQQKAMVPTGIMVHSTATPGIMAADWIPRWNKSGVTKCVHAFVDDQDVIQTLPWTIAGWHSGVGSLGKAKNANNTGYIGFEICEPAGHTYKNGAMVGYDANAHQAYFDAAYQNAVDLSVMLCRLYGIDPENILCHSEGYTRGIASDHSDVMQWFPKHGKSMDTFREDVRKALQSETAVRSFRLLQEMNFRETPNGKKLGAIPDGTVITGDTLITHQGIGWLNVTFNGQKGVVAVLPEEKGYALELPESGLPECEKELIYYKEAYQALNEKMERIKAILAEN